MCVGENTRRRKYFFAPRHPPPSPPPHKKVSIHAAAAADKKYYATVCGGEGRRRNREMSHEYFRRPLAREENFFLKEVAEGKKGVSGEWKGGANRCLSLLLHTYPSSLLSFEPWLDPRINCTPCYAAPQRSRRESSLFLSFLSILQSGKGVV